MLFTSRLGTRIYNEGSVTLGLNAGLAPMPGTIDPRVSTERHQLRADTPRGWSIVAEVAGLGYSWGGAGPRFFGFVLHW